MPKRAKRKAPDRISALDVVAVYTELYERIQTLSTAKEVNSAFSDKELRLLMAQNSLLINDYDPVISKYVEKTKLQKSATVLAIKDSMA